MLLNNEKAVVDYPEGPMNTSSTHHLSRSAKIALGWLAVVAMAAVIFWMSANTGESINSGLGIISAIKGALSAGAQWVFGHEVDVSPVGHFTEYLVFRRGTLQRAAFSSEPPHRASCSTRHWKPLRYNRRVAPAVRSQP